MNFLTRIIAILVFSFLFSFNARSGDIEYLKNMPSVEKILSTIKGEDINQTTYRQVGFLGQMLMMIDFMNDGTYAPSRHGNLSPEEKALSDTYIAASEKIGKEYLERMGLTEKNKIDSRDYIDWSNSALQSHNMSRDWCKEYYKKLFPPDFLQMFYDRLAKARAKNNADWIKQQKENEKQQEEMLKKSQEMQQDFYNNNSISVGGILKKLFIWAGLILVSLMTWIYVKKKMNAKSENKPKWYFKNIIIVPLILFVAYLLRPQLPSYLSIPVLINYLISSLLYVGVSVLGIILIIWILYKLVKGSKGKAETEKSKIQKPFREFWLSLGNDINDREKNIRRLFEAKTGNIPFGDRLEIRNYGAKHFIQFQLSRNLASMEQREREFLRTTFLLYNSGLLSNSQWEYYCFAFVNGNGKASVDSYSYYIQSESTGVKNAPSAVKYYEGLKDASVDSAINSLMGLIEKLSIEGKNTKLISEIKNRTVGGGAWLSCDEIENTIFQSSSSPFSLNIGVLEGEGCNLRYSGEGSLITIAPPGSGKTQCFVLPNMLSWKGAVVVLDIKGEIYAATSKWRSQNIGPVYKFSPLDPANSHCYNPLSFIRQESDYIWEDSRFLADMMIVPSATNDPFWENSARDVITAAIAYITMYNPPQQRAISKVMDILYGIGWDEMVIALKTNVMVNAMRQSGHSLASIEKKTLDSVLRTAQSSMSAWQGERISKVTQKSDWSPLDLRKGSPTIYICINPNEIDSYLSLLRVVIAQHIRMLTSELPGRDAVPVLFMLDELPRLKKMPPIDEALNIGRQYGIKLWMFAQSYGQLKEAYSNPEGLLGSCMVRTFMNIPLNDEFTTKLSDQLGYREGPLDATRQKLVEPLELAGPNYRDTILVLASNTKPAKVKKKFAYEDKGFSAKMN